MEEILIEIFLQLFLELFWEGLFKKSKKDIDPKFLFFIYLFLGIVSGFISLLMFNSSIIKDENLKIINLIFAPISVGFVVAYIGKLRSANKVDSMKWSHFINGYIFALMVAIVRFAISET